VVKLIALTQPVDLEGISNAEELVSYIARVSNPTNQLNTETAPKLLSYLVKHKHWSPYEHVFITFEIKTSRAIAAQILRHRSFTFQEFSQRYSTATDLEHIEFRNQGKTNRQVGDDPAHLPLELASEIRALQSKTLGLYESLIKQGVAKECARMVLPLNTSTTMYMSGSLRSWIHYLQIRNTIETQKEHRVIAQNIQKILEERFKVVFNALNSTEV
jgi:thymidylate synthase (FAD)